MTELVFGSFKNPKLAKKLCLVDANTLRALSYFEMDSKTSKAADLLNYVGVKPGDIVNLLLENSLGFFIPWLGSVKIGAVANPIDYFLPPNEILRILKYCKAKILVTQERFIWNFKERTNMPLLELIAEFLPNLLILVMPDKFEGKTRPSPFSSNREKSASALRWDKYIDCALPPRKEADNGKFSLSAEGSRVIKFRIKKLAEEHNLSENSRSLISNALFSVFTQYAFLAATAAGGTSVLAPAEFKNIQDVTSRWHINTLLSFYRVIELV